MAIPIEQLIDIIQQDLTFSGMMPKQIPDTEIRRIIKEIAADYFYKNYQFSVIRSYYMLKRECMTTAEYLQYRYIEFPQEIENVTKIIQMDAPSMFRLGIQAPYLSVNLGVTNQPFLTSFITTAGDLGVYRSIISGFADEINKMTKSTIKFSYNNLDHRLHLLSNVEFDMVLEVYVRIEEEELFDNYLFKMYCTGLSRMRLGEMLGRMNITMPGGFNWQSSEVYTQGKDLVTEVIEKLKAESQVSWFFMSK